ncbi:MAG: DNA translocase FtsK 4TM domain-containing protein [Bacteroidota bacterium]
MARAKKKNPKQASFNFWPKDERLSKLLGLFLLFLAFYLLIAFISYLFTWRIDQARVRDSGLAIFIHDAIPVANQMGRLGAFFSNLFFYYLFGLGSFFVVYFLYRLGLNRLRRQPLALMANLLVKTSITMLALSVLLDFLLGSTMDFPIGGGIGAAVNGYLQNLLGAAGIILLLLALVGLYLVLVAKIDFSGSRTEIRTAVVDHFSEQVRFRNRPGSGQSSHNSSSSRKTLKPAESATEKLDRQLSDKPAAAPMQAETLRPGGAELELNSEAQPTGDQLSIPLTDVEKRAPKPVDPLAVGQAALEINDAEDDGGLTPQLAASEENVDHSEPYDSTLELPSYEQPVLMLLKSYEDQKTEVDRAELESNKDLIIETLLNFKIEITKIRATIGPTVTLYEIVPAPGVRISKIKNLEDDIALSLAALGIRIIAPIPGRGTIGIEVPNKNPQIVSMREVIESDKFRNAKMDLPLALGKTIKNEVLVADLGKMPHLLVAGATGQGKSVGINSILMSLLYKKHPSQIKFVLIDPKKVELFPYAKLEHHFLAFLPGQTEPITTETAKVIHILNSLCIEMDQRYDLLKKASARNIKEYNEKFVARRLNPQKGHKFLPFLILVIDEFADLIMTAGKEVEMPIARLAQLARAVGIHLIIATQRPSVNIITGVIKANFPARVAYKVTAKVDSRTILDSGGADQLIGRGDMLLSHGGDITRLQGAFVDTPEVEQVIDYIAGQKGYAEPYLLPEFNTDEEISGSAGLTYADLDDMFEQAARLIVGQQHGSTSMIQRRLKLGYNRAGRIMDELEQMGIVGPANGSKPREVLVYDEIELERYIQDIKKR